MKRYSGTPDRIRNKPGPGTERLYGGRDDGFSVRSVVVLRIRTSRKVFVKGMYIEDVDVNEMEDVEPVENLDTPWK
jgi:hypothetical protein